MAFGIGGNKSSSKATSKQNIFDPQAQALSDVYQAGQDTYNQGIAGGRAGQALVPGATRGMNQVTNLGMGGMQNQNAGGAWGNTDDVRQQMLQQMQGGRTNMGTMYESIVGGPGNTYIDPMVDAMKIGMNQNRDTMMSGNGLAAAAAGQGGSSRHAMQNAMTNKQINQDMSQAEMNMRGNAYDTDLNRKMDIARMADANQQSNLDRMYNMINAGNASQQFAMNYAPTQQANTMGRFAPQMMANQMPWMNTDAYANVVGDPTILTDQTSKGKSGGFNLGFG